MRARFCTWLVAVTAVGAFAVPNMALAGPVEELVSIALHPKDPNIMAIRYQNGGGGLIYSADAGKSWKVMCASMIAPGEKAEGPLRLTSDGRTLLGLFAGMWQGAGGGCGWAMASEFEGVRVSDVTAHPADPDITFAVTGSGTLPNDIRRRDASGVWSDVGSKDEAILSRLRIAMRGSDMRFYESGQRGTRMVGSSGTPVANYLIRVSDDGGTTWSEHPVDVADGTMRLEAVDPKQPDRILISIDRTVGDDTILVSNDQGASFNEYLTISALGGIAVAPDGRIWIGEFGNVSSLTVPKGLWFAPSLDMPPAKITGDYQVECLAYQPSNDTLYACQRWSAGSVDQKTGAFTKIFELATAKEFVDCGTDAPAVCKPQLCSAYCGPTHFCTAPLCSVYSDPTCGPLADGGGPALMTPMAGATTPASSTAGTNAVAAATPAASPPVSSGSKGGGCAATASGPFSAPAGQMAFIGLCAVALWRRYRRREPRLLA